MNDDGQNKCIWQPFEKSTATPLSLTRKIICLFLKLKDGKGGCEWLDDTWNWVRLYHHRPNIYMEQFLVIHPWFGSISLKCHTYHFCGIIKFRNRFAKQIPKFCMMRSSQHGISHNQSIIHTNQSWRGLDSANCSINTRMDEWMTELISVLELKVLG